MSSKLPRNDVSIHFCPESFEIPKTHNKVLVDGKCHHGFPVPWAFVCDGGVGGIIGRKNLIWRRVRSAGQQQKNIHKRISASSAIYETCVLGSRFLQNWKLEKNKCYTLIVSKTQSFLSQYVFPRNSLGPTWIRLEMLCSFETSFGDESNVDLRRLH